jgi:hypothetical protein
MSINCPYNKYELLSGLICASNKMEKYYEDHPEADMDKDMDQMGEAVTPSQDKNVIAQHHGIPLEMLVNSPNYDKLVSEYHMSCVNKMFKAMKDKFDLTDKESWALLDRAIGKED